MHLYLFFTNIPTHHQTIKYEYRISQVINSSLFRETKMLLSLEVIKADRINEQFKTRNTSYFYQNFPKNSSLRQPENNERKKVL